MGRCRARPDLLEGMTPEQYANPPAETDAFLASEQDVLEDALSYAMSTLVLTKARGRHGPDAVLDLAERLQEYARYISSGGDAKEPSRIGAVAPPEPPVVPPQMEKPDPKKDEETPEVEPMEWSAFKWLHGNHSVDRAIITTLMKDFKPPAATADKSKGDAEMAFCQALCEGGEKRIQEMLTKGKVVDQLAEKIHAAAQRLKEGGSKEGSTGGLNTKFVDDYGATEMAFGQQDEFFKGLEGIIGPPNPDLVKAMRGEHCERTDSTKPFTTSNYNIETSSCASMAKVP